MSGNPTSLQFFGHLKWLDGRALLDTIEPYRRELFTQALDEIGTDGRPRYNLVLAGRGKKNAKSLDLVLAALYCLLMRRSPQGNSGFIVASDEGQAADDLDLARKLVACNPDLRAEIEPLAKELRLRDGSGGLRILPGKDIAGSHGKTSGFIGFDEVHNMRDWNLLEALQPDPTRPDALTWITSYDTIYNVVGVPLHDLKRIGRSRTDPRMLFSWYSADLCTDAAFAELPPELRANPSISSWPEGAAYLEQQKLRLPTNKYRRLHLNLPGAPTGAFFDQGAVLAAIVEGRRALPPEDGVTYCAFVDMSGGSADDAVLAIAHKVEQRVVVDLVEKQAGGVPFDPRAAVEKFCGILKRYRVTRVVGDHYAGLTFELDFQGRGIVYECSALTTTELYEQMEPRVNAGEIELPDLPVLTEQLVTLVQKGARVTHESGAHDDWANAVAGAVQAAAKPSYELPGFFGITASGIAITSPSYYGAADGKADADAEAAAERERVRAAEEAAERYLNERMRWHIATYGSRRF
jgi:hypothetical protein